MNIYQVITIIYWAALVCIIYKLQTRRHKIQANISSMNLCFKCGRPMASFCPYCTGTKEPETLLGATPVIAMRVFRVDLDTLTLHSLNSGSFTSTKGMGEPWIPSETKTAECAIHNRHRRLRFINAVGDIEIAKFDPSHDAPVWGCTCGIWSCKSREALAKTVPSASRHIALKSKGKNPQSKFIAKHLDRTLIVSAQVYQWGRIVEHTWGYRSQHARIIPESIQMYPRTVRTARDKRLIQTLRRKYSNG